jgi:hypothetical protein
MKLILRFVLGCVLLQSCSSAQKQDVTLPNTDSVTFIQSDSGDTNSSYANFHNLIPPEDTLTLALEDAISKLADAMETKMVYKISATFSGYENGVDANYYYDSLLNLTYCTVSWSSEGTSGNYTYYFHNNSLIASRENNYYNDSEELTLMHSQFKPTFGTSLAIDTADVLHRTLLGAADYNEKNSSAISEYDRLINRIKLYQDSASVNTETVTLQIQNTVNYGEDFTEQEDFEISRKVFDTLIKD